MFRQKTKDTGYTYDELPQKLRVQLVYILRRVIGEFAAVYFHGPDAVLSRIREDLCRELGLLTLISGSRSAEEEIYTYLLQEKDVTQCLKAIEVIIAGLVRFVQDDPYVNFNGGEQIRHGVVELNQRFRENAVGYEFRDGSMIRIDSGFMHTEVVSPAMTLLREAYLTGANEEFLKAHDHFRHRRFAECINECLKAFESTMKAICHKRKWAYKQTDTAKPLLAICERNGLFPPFLQSSFSGLRAVLENVPTVRNKMSGHGQGAQLVQVTEELAAFALHSTGANILLLVSLEKNLK